jgi:hypothetical protein
MGVAFRHTSFSSIVRQIATLVNNPRSTLLPRFSTYDVAPLSHEIVNLVFQAPKPCVVLIVKSTYARSHTNGCEHSLSTTHESQQCGAIDL